MISQGVLQFHIFRVWIRPFVHEEVEGLGTAWRGGVVGRKGGWGGEGDGSASLEKVKLPTCSPPPPTCPAALDTALHLVNKLCNTSR